MPLTFRKSFRVLPGVLVNIGAKSMSVTVGPRNGPKRTWSTTGRTTTSVNLPGPFGYRRSTRRGRG